jgi:WD40-like Beta Propeller Repeat
MLHRAPFWHALLLISIATAPLRAQRKEQNLRQELAEQEQRSGYSLVDAEGRGGEGYVVSVIDRTARKMKVKSTEDSSSMQCSLPGRRYSLFYKNGLRLRDTTTGTAELIDASGESSGQCWAPDQTKFVYGVDKKIRIYDVAERKAIDIAEGQYPTWSPDGKWIGFYEEMRFTLMDPSTRVRKKLFKNRYLRGAQWSPDSRYITYTITGGPTGGFLFWGIKCIEPYRVWVWRLEDGAHDWVLNICKPGRQFSWVMNSDISTE